MLTNETAKTTRHKPQQNDMFGLRGMALDECGAGIAEIASDDLPLFEHAKDVLAAQEQKKQGTLL